MLKKLENTKKQALKNSKNANIQNKFLNKIKKY